MVQCIIMCTSSAITCSRQEILHYITSATTYSGGGCGIDCAVVDVTECSVVHIHPFIHTRLIQHEVSGEICKHLGREGGREGGEISHRVSRSYLILTTSGAISLMGRGCDPWAGHIMSSDILAARIQDSIINPNLVASTRPFSWTRDSVRREGGREGGRDVRREGGREGGM